MPHTQPLVECLVNFLAGLVLKVKLANLCCLLSGRIIGFSHCACLKHFEFMQALRRIKSLKHSRHRWLTPVILATQEAEIRGFMV
jgi:hypothetical protein